MKKGLRAVIALFLMSILMMGCATTELKLPRDYCARFRLEWAPENNVPAQTICVCTEDLWPGLEAALGALISRPKDIYPTGIVEPADCGKDLPQLKTSAPPPGTDPDVEAMLTR